MSLLIANFVGVSHAVLMLIFVCLIFLSIRGRLHMYPFWKVWFWVWIAGKIGSYLIFGACILTQAEQYFREIAGVANYEGGYFVHYFGALGITVSDQFVFWLVCLPVVIAVASEAYWYIAQNRHKPS